MEAPSGASSAPPFSSRWRYVMAASLVALGGHVASAFLFPLPSSTPSGSSSLSTPMRRTRSSKSPATLLFHQKVPVQFDHNSEDVSWMDEIKARLDDEGMPEPVFYEFSYTTVPSVLVEIFDELIQASKDKRSRFLIFPDVLALKNSHMMKATIDHLDLCKDCCEILGASMQVVPYHPESSTSYSPTPSFLIEPIPGGGGDDYIFGESDDPYWNDDSDDLAATYMGLGGDDKDAPDEALFQVPDDDAELVDKTKLWMDAVIADLGVCPFTVDKDRAGLPTGSVRYEVSREMSPEAVYRDYWKEVALITEGGEDATEKKLSTTLLILPSFGLRNCEAFETFSNTLTQALEGLAIENDIQLVFFHPQWVFRDGADRIGNDAAANYARRSPWPMINILRTPQVKKAQKAIPTGLVYRQNEVTLAKIGCEHLEKWLRERDWSDVKDNYKVDRRTIPVLNTAQNLIHGDSTTTVPLAPVAVPAKEIPPSQIPGNIGVEEDDDDDWDKPFDSLAALDLGDDVSKSVGDSATNCRAILSIIRKRMNGGAPLTPHEVKELEWRIKELA